MTDGAPRPIVVDASVAVKWVLIEDLSDRALALHQAGSAVGRPMVAPMLLPNEVANAIYQQLRRELITEPEADTAIATFPRFGVDLLAPANLVRQAYDLARAHQLRAVYDSLYVVLAQRLGADLWTADRRLLKSIGAVAPWVRWIGDFSEAEQR